MKKLLSIAAVSALVLTGCSKELKVKTVDKLTVEYGDTLDNNKLFDAKKSDKNIKVDKVQDFNAKKVGDYFAEKLKGLPHVKEVRHQGLLTGIEFDDTLNAVDIKHACFDRKLLVTAIGSSVIRTIPPLIVTEEECDKAFAIMKEAVESLA